jgi:hypothetical protein
VPDPAFVGAQHSCLPAASADEDALRAARPHVAVWVDKLRHAGHVVFVRKMRSGAKRNAGFRIDVDGRAMTIWQMWARFRSVVGGGKPPHKASNRQRRYGKFAETRLVAELLEGRSVRAVGWQGRLGRERQVCRPHREGENQR